MLATLAMLAITAGARFVTVTNDYKAMFGEGNPQLIALENLESTFSESNAALVAIAPREGSVFSRQTLTAIEEFTEVAWHAPYSVRVDSLTNYFHSRAFEDDIVVEPLVDDAQSLTDADLMQIRSVALDAPDITKRLISDDERVSGLVVNFALPDDNPGLAWHEIANYLEEAIDQAHADHPHIDYYLTGDIIMHPAFAEATEVVFATIGPLAFLMLLAATALLLRSLYGTVAVAFLIMFVTNTTLGIAGWLETQFTPASRHCSHHRHDVCGCVFDPHHDCHLEGYEPRFKQKRGDHGSDSEKCLSGVSDHRHDNDWFSKPEYLGIATLSCRRKPCGGGLAFHLYICHDLPPRHALDRATACTRHSR